MNQLLQRTETDVLRIGSLVWPIAEFTLIGESTIQDGPYADDWFLVLTRRDGHWIEASMYAEGEQLRQQLSTALGCPLQVGLANSADFASRIIWPLALAERPVFTYERVTSRSFLRRLSTFFAPKMAHCLSPKARSTVPPTFVAELGGVRP